MIMKKIKLLVLFVIFMTGFGYAQSDYLEDNKPQGASARTINAAQYIMYIPGGVEPDRKYPLVVAFSPSADAASMISAWKSVSEKYKWLILASKESRNGLDMKKVCDSHANILEFIIMNFPVDSDKIIATGFSGGGMQSHGFAMYYPKLIRAVVVNTAMIHENFRGRKEAYFYSTEAKSAVFLASPTDFRYNEMKADKSFLQGIGWKTKWIEFQGGHTMAPQEAYQQAAQWLEEQF